MLSIRRIGVIGRTYRNLNRYRQILTIFFKYGFGNLIDKLSIEQYLEIGLQMISRQRRERIERFTPAERFRLTLEELGPTFIKLGQILSTRPDLIPVHFIDELEKLQDCVPPFPFEQADSMLRDELGGTSETLFDWIDPAPVASASIGQVHRARLRDGEDVAIKFQRPGIHRIIEVDLEIMLHLATLAERHLEEISFHQPVKIVREFARTLERELDYTIEAANMDRVSRQFMDDRTVYIPKVYRDYSSHRVLTMEYINGIKISDINALKAAGLNPKKITHRGADFILKQVFTYGYFHADPHPGNLSVLPGNVICLFDFGMMGTISRTTKETFLRLIESVVFQEPPQTTRILLELTEWDTEPDMVELETDVYDFLNLYLYDKSLKDIEVGKLLRQLVDTLARYRLRIPPNIFLMMKAMSTVEGVALRLDPDFDLIRKATPFIKKARLSRFSPERLTSELVHSIGESVQFIQEFPRDLLTLTRLIKNEKFTLNVEIKGMKSALETHDQVSNRIAFSIIIASLIMGSALLLTAGTPPIIYGISLIGLIGFVAAGIMGVWLLIAILKSGRL